MKVSITNAKHYQWGDQCDGWHLLDSPDLSVIQERMPPGASEQLHYHQYAQQLFYILSGEAEFTVDETRSTLSLGDSITIRPNQVHALKNSTDAELLFLVISQPRSHGDRINTE